jgi:predicted ester cyclase
MCGMNVRELTERIAAAENAGDWEALGELFEPDVVIHHPGIGPVEGRSANIGLLQLIHGAVTGYHRTTTDLVAEGNRGAFRFTITGTHTGDLPGFPATDRAIEVSGAMHFEVVDGRLRSAFEIVNHDSIRGLSLR